MTVICEMGPLHYSEQTGPSGEALGTSRRPLRTWP